MNVADELAKLAQLRDQGVLSPEEFEQQKAAVLAGAHPATPEAANTAAGKKSMGKGCLIAVAVIVVLIIIGSIIGSGNKDATTTASDNSTAAAATPPVAVTATQLFDAYQANEAKAQQTYGDQRLLVSGTVEGVDLDMMDKPVVKLRTSNQFMSAQAGLTEASEPKAKDLNKGEKVALLCGGVGEVIGTPMLKDCEIQ